MVYPVFPLPPPHPRQLDTVGREVDLRDPLWSFPSCHTNRGRGRTVPGPLGVGVWVQGERVGPNLQVMVGDSRTTQSERGPDPQGV